MQFTGEFVVDGTPAEVWPYFNDPEILADCAPGCNEFVLESPSEIRASLEVGVGSVKPSFEVTGVVVECDEPDRLELQASGEASRNSFSVNAWQELADNDDGTTTVTWGADAEVSGVIASLGERALESVTDKLVNDFFEEIEDHVAAGTPATAQFEAAGEAEVAAADEAAAAASEDDPVDDLFALLGSVRGGTEEGAVGPATGGLVRSVAIGAAGGVVGALLWSRLRSGDAAAGGSGDADEERDGAAGDASGGENSRPGVYLFLGAVLGAAAKTLWDAYSSGEAASAEPTDAAATDVAAGETLKAAAEQDEEPATAREDHAAGATGDTAASDDDTAVSDDDTDMSNDDTDMSDDDTADDGMVDDPLDRLD